MQLIFWRLAYRSLVGLCVSQSGRMLLLDQTTESVSFVVPRPWFSLLVKISRSACVTFVRSLFSRWVTPDNLFDKRTYRILFESDGAATFECLPYQLSTVRYVRPMALTGNGESGFDSGEAAWETATTSKDGSRHANYPIPAPGGGSDEI